MSFEVKNIGMQPYADALAEQLSAHLEVLSGGLNTIILCEHPHVYTLGKSANFNNLLVNPDFLSSINAEMHHIDRGGDITYHGPGQLVCYPIINLKKAGIGVKKYVEILEKAIIQALSVFRIKAYQIDGLTGIWVGAENEPKRKIGAIGIRVKNGITMHGFALNVSTDLQYFDFIVPCGITDKQVTSVQKEIGNVSIDVVSREFVHCFEREWQNALALQS